MPTPQRSWSGLRVATAPRNSDGFHRYLTGQIYPRSQAFGELGAVAISTWSGLS